MARGLDDLDRRLLERVQEGIQLVAAPFAAMAEELASTEHEIIKRIKSLKAVPHPVIRQISAIFDSQSLGYQSCLVAARIPADRLEEAAAIIGAHPGVSHNYQREHDYNLWYTLAVGPDSRLGLDRTLEILHRRSGAIETRKLQTIQLFKIGVKLNLSDRSPKPQQPAATRRTETPAGPITEMEKGLIRILQRDFPIARHPFKAWADEGGMTEAELLGAAQSFIDRKWMRRFAGVLHHREAGFDANAMGVWIVPADQQEKFGRMAAQFEAVSHCYLRPTYPDWPYNIFTMVHATSRQECEAILAQISEATGIKSYRALYSTREFKKVRVKYFTGDIEAWEREALRETTQPASAIKVPA